MSRWHESPKLPHDIPVLWFVTICVHNLNDSCLQLSLKLPHRKVSVKVHAIEFWLKCASSTVLFSHSIGFRHRGKQLAASRLGNAAV